MPRDAEIVSRRAGLVRFALGGWAVLVYIFLFAPIVLLVAFAFNANKYGTFPFTGWTTKWFGQVFGDYQIKDAFVTTLTIAAEVTAISTIVGTAAAFPLVRSRLPFRTGIRIGITLPIYIYTQVKFGITPEVNALASLLLAASVTLIAAAFLLPPAIRRARRIGRPSALRARS